MLICSSPMALIVVSAGLKDILHVVIRTLRISLPIEMMDHTMFLGLTPLIAGRRIIIARLRIILSDACINNPLLVIGIDLSLIRFVSRLQSLILGLIGLAPSLFIKKRLAIPEPPMRLILIITLLSRSPTTLKLLFKILKSLSTTLRILAQLLPGIEIGLVILLAQRTCLLNSRIDCLTLARLLMPIDIGRIPIREKQIAQSPKPIANISDKSLRPLLSLTLQPRLLILRRILSHTLPKPRLDHIIPRRSLRPHLSQLSLRRLLKQRLNGRHRGLLSRDLRRRSLRH